MTEPAAASDGPPRRSGRPPITTRGALIAAARELGLLRVHTRSVSERVGIRDPTFYRYFGTIEELIAATTDAICDELELPERGGPWQHYVTTTCSAFADLLERHPGLAAAIARRADPPPRIHVPLTRVADALRDAGFPPEQAAIGARTLAETVSATWLTSPGITCPLAARRRQIESATERVDPRIRAEIAQASVGPARTWVAQKVALLITGLEVRLAAQGGSASGDERRPLPPPPATRTFHTRVPSDRDSPSRTTSHRERVHPSSPPRTRGRGPPREAGHSLVWRPDTRPRVRAASVCRRSVGRGTLLPPFTSDRRTLGDDVKV